MTHYRYADLGVRPNRPGEQPGAYWSAMFMGGKVQNAVHFEFHEEPEDRAIQEIREHLGAEDVRVTRPVRTPPVQVTAGEFDGPRPDGPGGIGTMNAAQRAILEAQAKT
jgi:hypothetical protein